jgi:hypothetical protein
MKVFLVEDIVQAVGVDNVPNDIGAFFKMISNL